MEIVLERLSREWQGQGGPPVWDAAWDRTRALVLPRRNVFASLEGEYATEYNLDFAHDAVGGLAMALYILAVERRVDPDAVPRHAVEDMLRRRADEPTIYSIPPRWECHLENLGHDVESATDPVAVRWRALKISHEPDEKLFGDDATFRRGPVLIEGLRYALSAHADLAF